MTYQNCPICGGDFFSYIIKKDYQIIKCKNCGLGITQNLLPQKGDYHRDQTYIEEKDLFTNIFSKRVDILMKIAKPKSVLEIGCSTGLMLNLFKEKSYQVMGVEMSKSSAYEAIKKGIVVKIGDFLKISLKNKFDLIVLNHTLEHISDPNKFIKKASEYMNSGSFLYIDLPNFNSLTATIFKSRWSLLLPKEHLWHFTQNSLKILLEKHGFKIVFSEKSSGIWDYKNPVLGLMISLFSFKKRFFRELVTAIPSFILTKLQIGSDLMVIAKKI